MASSRLAIAQFRIRPVTSGAGAGITFLDGKTIKGERAAEDGGQREVKVSVDMIARADTPYRYHSNRWP